MATQLHPLEKEAPAQLGRHDQDDLVAEELLPSSADGVGLACPCPAQYMYAPQAQ